MLNLGELHFSASAERGAATAIDKASRLTHLSLPDLYRACVWFVRASAHAEVGSLTHAGSTDWVKSLDRGRLAEYFGTERVEECRKDATTWEPTSSP